VHDLDNVLVALAEVLADGRLVEALGVEEEQRELDRGLAPENAVLEQEFDTLKGTG